MQRKMFRFLIFLLLATTALFVSPVRAEEPTKTPLSVSPAIAEWILAPGESQQKSILVANNSDKPLLISAVIKSFDVQQKLSSAESAIYDASKWFTINEPDFIVQPHDHHATTVTLHLPKDASVGGHYATLYFRQLSQATATSGAMAVGQVGAHMFIVAKGQIKPALRADDPVQLSVKDGVRTLSVTLQNTGNVHVLPVGTIVVKDWRGKERRFPIEYGIILPHTKRTYSVTLTGMPPLGWFSADVDIMYNNTPLPTSNTRSVFWILPEANVVIIFLILAVIVAKGYGNRDRILRAIRALRSDK